MVVLLYPEKRLCEYLYYFFGKTYSCQCCAWVSKVQVDYNLPYISFGGLLTFAARSLRPWGCAIWTLALSYLYPLHSCCFANRTIPPVCLPPSWMNRRVLWVHMIDSLDTVTIHVRNSFLDKRGLLVETTITFQRKAVWPVVRVVPVALYLQWLYFGMFCNTDCERALNTTQMCCCCLRMGFPWLIRVEKMFIGLAILSIYM